MRMAKLIPAMLLALAAPAAAQTGRGELDFTYAYPAQARAIPALKAWLDGDAARQRARYAGMAADERRDAAKEGRTFRPYDADRTWKVVADTPRFLSLSLETYDFTGGAHGNSGFDALLWDRSAGQRRTPLSLFASRRALAAAIRAPFCRQLDAQRQEKRGGDGKDGFADFDACIDPVAETVILGSASRRRFDRIGILIPPYEAGPYSEGTYEVTLPVTPAVIAAVRPEFRAFFATGTP